MLTSPWTGQSERGSLFWLKIITWIALHLGRPVARLLLHPITLYFMATSSSSRAASKQFLQRALSRQPTFADVFRHHHCFAATILDRVYLLCGETERFDVRIFNSELIAEKVDTHEGCILLGSHLGSFEILRALGVKQKRFPIKVLMDIRHNPEITSFLHSLSSDIADTVIHTGDLTTLIEINEAIHQGYLVGILGDRVLQNEERTVCTFLDSPAHFSTLPANLARVTNAPVVLFFGIYLGANRYDIHFENLMNDCDTPTAHRKVATAELTDRYARRLELYARKAPYNWFNFYDYWTDFEPYSTSAGTPERSTDSSE